MADVSKVENLILGGGEAGKYIAWELAREGRRTAVVERALIGGSCPNIACLPTKNIISSARVAYLGGSRLHARRLDRATNVARRLDNNKRAN